ncbi:diguanylate cyclase [Solirubrobacter sp. CPCC 204708]|uniref:Diguanylate cyclase n=1 Tax=Solirubrobacter deserti TaxID=2282478 RepID=A0ABT4RJY4_9ACTN|nr:diguanylate cyclase [Solirubrobacter deserti]MBE2315821.1 diguanylate cyclase [Solirubrobacter deserti]MDA0138843.1 diguanylate cyclase [Solirubrobacter deserti]
MLRRLSPLSLFVWSGVLVVLAWAVMLVVELNRAAETSKQALDTAKVNAVYEQAQAALRASKADAVREALVAAAALDPAERARVERIQKLHAAYEAQPTAAFAGSIQHALEAGSAAAGVRAHQLGIRAYAGEKRVVDGGRQIIVLACFVFGALWWLLRQHRRRLEEARRQELKRLSEMASSDPLTGLRNHRVFHEDLARELQRAGRTGSSLALVLLDLDNLKTLNDTHGHQAGDRRIRELADALRETLRATDTAYRIGGDEFAVLLPDAHTWGALEFTQRLHQAFPGATAGIAATTTLVARDALIHDADMALLTAKRTHQRALVYTQELDPGTVTPTVDDHHTQTLAAALAHAVDAKDSYTRSHCQTVSQLSALIAEALGFEGERLARMRLAGLLHDVGKIGVPDAILNKRAALTEAEYEVMKQHAVLGAEIVESAGLPEQARWVRHHHERIDGRGYPDGLAGEEIPLESRIILVADSFEAMTSDRPYRRAPGREFALAELRCHAGAQFDPDVVDALCRVLDDTRELAHDL